MCELCKEKDKRLADALNANANLLLRIDQLQYTLRQKNDLIEALILDLKEREKSQ